MNRRTPIWLYLLAGGLSPALLVADEGGFDAGVAVSSQYTDNARKTRDNKLGERQDRLRFWLSGEYENNLLEMDANYRANRYRFNEDSQRNRSLWEGDATLTLGKDYHTAGLMLNHTRRARLGAPGQVDLLRNTDEQQIFTAVPMLRFRPTPIDALWLRGHYTEVDYRFAEQRNSNRQGGSLIWLRHLSTISNAQVTALHSEVSFDAAPDFDYTYQSAAASYSRQLRYLSYRAEVGINTITPVRDESFSGLIYGLHLRYATGYHQFSVSANQYFTDTSMGGRNNPLDELDFGEVRVTMPDQLERSTIQLRWHTSALCASCEAHAAVVYQRDEYRRLHEDGSELGGRLGFYYEVNSYSEAGVIHEGRHYRFAEEVGREDYSLARIRFDYRQHLLEDLDMQLYASYEERFQDTETANYTALAVGLLLEYRFW
jgi:hypothetical protein